MADTKQGKPSSEDLCNGTSQSRVVLAKPRLGGFGSSGFGSSSSKSNNPFSAVLRPPQLKPTSNPFLKVADGDQTKDKPEKEKIDSADENKQDEKKEDEVPKFVPLGSTNVTARTANPVPTPAQPATSSSSSGFVFGQNLSDRVVIKEQLNNGETSVDHSSTNGNSENSELLFTSAAAIVNDKDNVKEDTGNSELSGGEGLAAAAAEYERSHARPPPPTTNITVTGEEGETNVLQISCRLFAWEGGSWRERGRGMLRLNDAAGGGARLVVRVAGSLRVVLNTKLWPDMVVERAGTKSLRITAADHQHHVKLFLIMAAPGDVVHLYRALTSRVAGSKRMTTSSTCTQNTTSQKAAERLEATVDDNDYLDKPDEKQSDETPVDDEQEDESNQNERIHDTEQKTDDLQIENDVDIEEGSNEAKSLKRKEPVVDETSPKRQCPEIIIE